MPDLWCDLNPWLRIVPNIRASTSTGFRTVPQLGRVILEDDVEVGANTTIVRGFSLLYPSGMTYKPPIPKGQVELDRAAALA